MSWQPFLPYAARFIPIDYFVNGTVLDYIVDNQPHNFFILEDTAEGFLNVLRLKGAREMSLNDLIYDISYGENYTLTAIKNLKRNDSNGVIFTVPHFKNLGISSWDIKALTNEETATYEKAVDVANQHILEWAKLNGLAVVDLDALYLRVKDRQVTIGKDIRVNVRFEGNFFSSDGVYPSTLGQAIVANEVIKAINSQFKSKIQPIDGYSGAMRALRHF